MKKRQNNVYLQLISIMTITIEEARKLLPPEYSQISDEEIQRMLDYMYFVCDFAWNWQKEHP